MHLKIWQNYIIGGNFMNPNKKFMEEHLEEIRDLLCRALKNGYGGGRDDLLTNANGDFSLVEDKWRLVILWKNHGEHVGSIKIWYDGKLCWVMLYNGMVAEGADAERLGEFLSEVLATPNPEMPLRGVEVSFDNDRELFYTNDLQGDLVEFEGAEQIIDNSGYVEMLRQNSAAGRYAGEGTGDYIDAHLLYKGHYWGGYALSVLQDSQS